MQIRVSTRGWGAEGVGSGGEVWAGGGWDGSPSSSAVVQAQIGHSRLLLPEFSVCGQLEDNTTVTIASTANVLVKVFFFFEGL